MTLVTVVVIGHALVLVLHEERTPQLYDFIYFWHIPAFVLVTGYLSRSFAWTRPKLWALFCTIVVPYLIFEWAMLTFRHHYGDHDTTETTMWLDPHWPMWYLSATFLWRMATPILVKHWSAIPLSVVASLAIGTQDAEWTTYLDLQRTIGFLPFFVLGLHLRSKDLQRVRGRFTPILGLAVVVGLYQLAGHSSEWLVSHGTWPSRWLWYSHPYDSFGISTGDAMWIRFRILVLGVIGTFAVMSLVPRGRSWFTAMGAATLVVYLFHGFVVRRLEYADYTEWADDHGSWTIWFTIGVAVLIALVLAAPPVARRLTWFVDPIGSIQRARSR